MKTIKQILIIVLLMKTVHMTGQTTINKQDIQPYIEVVGTAEMEVIPDKIYLKIVIHEKYDNKVKITITEQEEKFKNSIEKLGINLSSLTISDSNLDFVKIRWQKNELLTQKEYILILPNATMVGKVFLELEKLEIKDANIIKVDHTKIDSLRKEIRIQAIKAAKEKADYLLIAIGEETGKPIEIRETKYETVRNTNAPYVSSNYTFDYDSKISSEIQFQTIKIQSSIYIKFLIK